MDEIEQAVLQQQHPVLESRDESALKTQPRNPWKLMAQNAPQRKDSLFRRIMRVVLSKTFALAFLLVVQIALVVTIVYLFASTGVLAYAILALLTLVVIVALFEQDNLNPAYKMMWMLVILVLPATGVLFYLMWGHRSVPRKKRRALVEVENRAEAVMAQDPAVMASLYGADKPLARNAEYLVNYAASPVYPARQCLYYPIGEDFFPDFLDAIRNAKKYIFMEYYIYQPGVMLDTTLAILRQKAAEGVDVRLVWDGFGSLFTLPPGFDKMLRKEGIKCYVFSPLEFTVHVSAYAMLNHRDHRKITVVDGEVAFSGGLNFADEYINAIERFGEWKDTAFKVTGEAAKSMAMTFLLTWDYVSDERTDLAEYTPCPCAEPEMDMAKGFVQPYWDSPLDGENVCENAYLNVIRQACDYVYISTPYLILDHEMITYLTLAAKSGIDVRILTPGIPDKPKVFLVTRSYYPALLEAGVRVFEYTPGFNHAKMYVSDDKVAIVGSANMDFRSLYLHFENCAAFYGGPLVKQAKADMEQNFSRAREMTIEDTRNTKPFTRLAQAAARFFAPML